MPQAEVPLALLFFNIGIEVGQIAFIFAVVALWWTLRRGLASLEQWLAEPDIRGQEQPLSAGRSRERRWLQEQQWLPVPVYVLGSLAAMWCIERGLEMDSPSRESGRSRPMRRAPCGSG